MSDAIVTSLGNNTYQVSGVHLYSTPGQYQIEVQAQEQPDTQTTVGGNEIDVVLLTIATVS